MAKSRGYPGGPTLLRAWVAELRPRPTPEAYLRLRTLPGEQGQVDWGAFGHVMVGNAKRPLVGFVMVLSWSRAVFLRFYLNQRMDSFLHGHVAAFETWGGLPRTLLYDYVPGNIIILMWRCRLCAHLL
jgi:transposase